MIAAHDTPVAALIFNTNATLLATASEKVCISLSIASFAFYQNWKLKLVQCFWSATTLYVAFFWLS